MTFWYPCSLTKSLPFPFFIWLWNYRQIVWDIFKWTQKKNAGMFNIALSPWTMKDNFPAVLGIRRTTCGRGRKCFTDSTCGTTWCFILSSSFHSPANGARQSKRDQVSTAGPAWQLAEALCAVKRRRGSVFSSRSSQPLFHFMCQFS